MNDIKRRRFLQSMLAVSTGILLAPRPARPAIVQPHALVVGSGVGGQAFVRALSSLAPSVRITCIDPAAEVVAEPRITRLSDAVAELDFHNRTVRTAAGASLGYDALVLSPGAEIRWGAIEGYTPAAAELMPHGWIGTDRGAGLRKRLAGLARGATVIVYVPAGVIRFPAGVDQRIKAISRYLRQNNPRAKLLVLDARPGVRADLYLHQAIERVPLMPEEDILSVDPKTGSLYSATNRFQGDLVNLIPPQQAGRIACRHGLADTAGWCPVNARNGRSLAEPGVYVLGDASAAHSGNKSALSARLQAIGCAEHLAREWA